MARISKKRAGVLALAVVMVAAAAVFVWRAGRPEQAAGGQTVTEREEQGVTYQEYYADAEEETLLLTAQWETPELTGASDQAAGPIQDYYETWRQQRQEELEQLREQAQAQQQTNAGFQPYFWEETYEIARQDGAVVSVLRTALTYTGGANAQTVWQADNFDGQTGAVLTLDALLVDENSRARLFALAAEEIAAQRAEGLAFYDGAETQAQAIHRSGNFYFTEQGLVLFFPVYDLAPFTEGPVRLTLPYETLHDIVKEEYLK